MQLEQFVTNLCLLDDLECCLTLDLLQFPAAEFNLMLGGNIEYFTTLLGVEKKVALLELKMCNYGEMLQMPGWG